MFLQISWMLTVQIRISHFSITPQQYKSFIMKEYSKLVTVKIMHKAFHSEFHPHNSLSMLHFFLRGPSAHFWTNPCSHSRIPFHLELGWIMETKHHQNVVSFHFAIKGNILSKCHGKFGYSSERMFYVVSKSNSQSITMSLQLWSLAQTQQICRAKEEKDAVKSKRTRASSSPSGFPPKGWLHIVVTHHPSNPRA